MAISKRLSVARNTPTGVMLALALKALKSEPVQARLKEAPEAAVRWAQKRRAAQRFPNVIDVEEAGEPAVGALEPASGGRFPNPAKRIERIGHRGLERRVEQLSTGFDAAFSAAPEGVPSEISRALDDLRRALTAVAGLPLAKRTRSHFRISSELDKLEDALIDSVLPKA